MKHAARIVWQKKGISYSAIEPSVEEVSACAQTLADWYNDPYNGSMMDNSSSMSAEDVVEHIKDMRKAGSRVFFLYRDDKLVGDADLRNIGPDAGEFAIMIGDRSFQGQGLGTTFSILVHVFAFRKLKLETVYLSIVPANKPGQRCYEKVGYEIDSGPLARKYADHDDDVTMSLDRRTFEERHRAVLADILAIGPRASTESVIRDEGGSSGANG